MLLLRKIGEYKNYTPNGLGGIVLYFLTGGEKKAMEGKGLNIWKKPECSLRVKDTYSKEY